MTQSNNQINDATALLYRNSIGGIIICIIAASVLVFAFPESKIFKDKVIWWAAIVALMSARLLDTWWWHKNTKSTEMSNPQFWLTKFRIGALLTACLWGLFGAFTMELMGDVEFVATVIILSSLAGAAPTPLSADRFLALVYSSLLIAPISLMGVLGDSYMRQVLGGMGLLFAFTMIFSALKITSFTREAIFLKNHNNDLLRQTSEDKQTLARQNLELEDSNQEITKIKESLEIQVAARTKELLALSETDGLTGLLNRRAFIERLQTVLQTKKIVQNHLPTAKHDKSYAVIFVDLNKFKKINDTQGHATGDRILQLVARVLIELPGEPVVSRWGGDEFVLFLNMDGNTQAMNYGELINTTIAHETRDYGLQVSASVGVSFSNRHSINANDLVKLADIAMFEHKKDPTIVPAVIYDHRFLTQLERTESLRNGLLTAIDNDELSLAYQPVYHLGKGEVISYEALLRWQFNGESIEPEEFVPIAEQSQMIYALGLWVLESACQDMLVAPISQDVTLSINVSIQQMKHPEFAQQVFEILKRTGFSSKRLQLEITESIFFDNPGALLSTISKLRRLGVQFAMDDFGTGYSSMVQLQALPLTCLKIDKRFVYDLNGTGGAIIRSVLSLAKELDMKVIVEGVETKRQLDLVHEMGIDLIQGYFCSKPQRFIDPDFKPSIIFENFTALH